MDRSPYKTDLNTSKVFDFIYQNALGIINVRNEAPTLATMKANTIEKYGTSIYIKFSDGTGIVLAGVALT